MLTSLHKKWTAQSSRAAARCGPPADPRRRRVAPALLAALALAGSGAARAQPTPPTPWAVDPVVGAWAPEITQRSCTTGAPLAVLKGTMVYHHGGTLSETSSSAPGSRGPGFGTWARHGDGYVSRFRLLRYFPDGNLAGAVVITRHFKLSADGHQITGTAALEIQDPSGTVVATGCATEVTARLP